MTTNVLATIGSLLIALAALYTAVVRNKPGSSENRTASAGEVEALGKRLDAQSVRIEKLEKTNRALYAYIAQDHAVHLNNGWDVTPLPEEIA